MPPITNLEMERTSSVNNVEAVVNNVEAVVNNVEAVNVEALRHCLSLQHHP